MNASRRSRPARSWRPTLSAFPPLAARGPLSALSGAAWIAPLFALRGPLCALLLAFLLLGQPAGVARAADVALIKSGALAPYNEFADAFQREMPGGSILYELQPDGSNADFISKSIQRQSPAVVVAVGPRAARLARIALPRVPLVCALVANTGRLGLSPTDLYWLPPQANPEDVIKALRIVAPHARSLGLVTSSPESPYVRGLADAAVDQGLELHALEARSEGMVPDRFRRAVQTSDAVWFLQDPVTASPASFEFVKRLCAERHIPLLVFSEGLARAGALLSLSPSTEGMGRQAARLAQRILSGAGQPAGMVSLEPGSVVRTLNLRVSSEMGLNLGNAAVGLAQRVLR